MSDEHFPEDADPLYPDLDGPAFSHNNPDGLTVRDLTPITDFTKEWIHTHVEAGPSEYALGELEHFFAQLEQTYPNTHYQWDRMRCFLALMMHPHLEATFRIFDGVSDIRLAAVRIVELAEGDEPLVARAALLPALLAHLGNASEPNQRQRNMLTAQAVATRLIEINPDDEYIEPFERYLTSADPGYDLVAGWARSLPTLYPDQIAAFIRDDEQWRAVPVRLRQHVLLRHNQFTANIEEDAPQPGAVAARVAFFNLVTDAHPAPVWDRFRGQEANRMLEKGLDPRGALELAEGIRDDFNKRHSVHHFIHYGQEAEGRLLAGTITNPALAAATLFDTDEPWRNPQAARDYLEALTLDENHPIDRRIAYLDHMTQMSDGEIATAYERRMNMLVDQARAAEADQETGSAEN